MPSSALDAANSVAVGAAVEIGGDTPNCGTLLSAADAVEEEDVDEEETVAGVGGAAASMRLRTEEMREGARVINQDETRRESDQRENTERAT